MFSPLRARGASSRVLWLCGVVFLDSVAQSISFPVLPRLTQSVLGGDPARTALWVGWLEVGWAAPFFAAAPFLGALSDRFGRRPVMALSFLGTVAEMVLDACARDVWWLLAGRAICGLTYGVQVAAMASVADVTDADERATAYGWVNGALYTGIIVGPVAGGLLAAVDIRIPFWIGMALAALGAVYVGILLPEPLPASSRAPFSVSQVAPWDALHFLFARRGLAPLAVVLLLSWLALQSSDNLLVLYTAHRYRWSAVTFGLFVAAAATLAIIVQGWVAGRLSARFGDRRVLIAGFTVQALGLTGMGLSPSGMMFSPVALTAVVGVIARPALQALMSRAAAAGEQGRLQGAAGAVSSLTSVVAPLIFPALLAWSIAGGRSMAWSGATILCGASLCAAAAVVSWRATRQPPRHLATSPE